MRLRLLLVLLLLASVVAYGILADSRPSSRSRTPAKAARSRDKGNHGQDAGRDPAAHAGDSRDDAAAHQTPSARAVARGNPGAPASGVFPEGPAHQASGVFPEGPAHEADGDAAPVGLGGPSRQPGGAGSRAPRDPAGPGGSGARGGGTGGSGVVVVPKSHGGPVAAPVVVGSGRNSGAGAAGGSKAAGPEMLLHPGHDDPPDREEEPVLSLQGPGAAAAGSLGSQAGAAESGGAGSEGAGGDGSKVSDPEGDGQGDGPHKGGGAECVTIADCEDGDPCTVDICNSGTGKCSYEEEQCISGDPCTEGWCEPYAGCRFEATGACDKGCKVFSECDDGNPCTEDMCDLPQGVCIHVSIDCEDNDYCTQDFCDPAVGCKHKYTAGCDACATDAECPPPAGNLCVKGTCDPARGKCQFAKKVCDDSDPCTEDYCVPESGECAQQYVCCAQDSECDAGNKCSQAKCVSGKCQISALSCDDKDQCTLDSCDTDVGCVYEKIPGCQGLPPGP